MKTSNLFVLLFLMINSYLSAECFDIPKYEQNQWIQTQGPLGSNPGGMYTNKQSKKTYYLKFHDKRLKSEFLSNQLYKLAKVNVSKTTLYEQKDQYVITSEWIHDLETFQQYKRYNNLNPLLKNSDTLNENFIIDCWLNNWDVVGTAYDNLSIENGKVIRIDTGGALNSRANNTKSKTESYGPEAFNENVNMLLTIFQQNFQARTVFAHTTLSHLTKGVRQLQCMNDKAIFDLVQKYGPSDRDQQLDLFMKLIKRKQYLINYVQFLNAKNLSPKRKVSTIVSDEKYGIHSFNKTSIKNKPISNPFLNKDTPIEEIAWDIVKNHYLDSEDDISWKILYRKTARPEYPIKRIKHGARHIISTALLIETLNHFHEQQFGKESLNENELKMLQIAAMFHDSGRKSDTGKDLKKWEEKGAEYCEKYLIALGYSKHDSTTAAKSIIDKDRSNPNKYAYLLHEADCIEVLRSHHWRFNQKFLYLSKKCTTNQQKQALHQLIINHRCVLSEMCDAPKNTNNLKQAMTFNTNAFLNTLPTALKI